jgi:hypothetical protein
VRPPDPRLPTASAAPVLTRDAAAGGLRWCPYACAIMRRSRWHVQASEAVDGVRRRAEPSYGLSWTIHAGATCPSRFNPIGAPIALPMRPPDDDPVDLTVVPLHTFECTTRRTRLQSSRVKRSRWSRGSRGRWSALCKRADAR